MIYLARFLAITLLCYQAQSMDISSLALGSRRRGSAERAGPNLLRPEETDNPFNQTSPGCWLGGHFYMVGDRWSPSIEPLGVMYCVKCQCAQIVKNKTVQLKGKVICANIKADCPRLTCDIPVLRPKTCCKVCPGQEPYFEDRFGQDVPTVPDATLPGRKENSKTKGLTALLVGSTLGRRKPVKTRAVAAVHVSHVTDNSFRYVIRFSRLKSPTFLRFTDQYGKTFLEKPIPHQTSRSTRLSGLWTEVPFIAMQYIIKEIAFIIIATTHHRNGEISGRLKGSKMASTATFEAVLTPPTPRGFGALAQMFYDDVKSIGSYVIHIDGIKYQRQDEFFVTFEKDTEIIHQHLLRISKSKSQIVGKLTVDKSTSKQLARGRLHMRVTSRTGDTVTGVLRPRMQRHDLLAVFQGDNKARKVTGFVALTLEEDGAIRYKVVVNGNDGTAVDVTLQRGSRKRWKPFASLPRTPEIHTAGQLTRAGAYKKIRARDSLAVLENRLKLQVKVGSDVIESFFEPTETKYVDAFSASHAVLRAVGCPEYVIVLYYMTPYCTFAYHVIARNRTLLVAKMTSSLRLSDRYTFREGSVSDSPEGAIQDIPDTTFRALRGGEAVLSWHISYGGCNEVASQQITVPNTCVAPSRPVISPGENEAERGTNDVYRCYHEGRFYTQGDTWAPADVNKCVTCRCDKGNVFCEEMPCPPTDCQYPRKRADECCPVCEDDNDTERKVLGSCYYHGDKRWHPVGSQWHPYVPPFGYSKCAVCTCLEMVHAGNSTYTTDSHPNSTKPRVDFVFDQEPEEIWALFQEGSLEVNCTRLPCPELECPQYQRVRLNRKDCCQVCRESRIRVAVSNTPNRDDCYFGNSVYKHGQKWHPWLTPFGEMKCYICSCKNGKSRCKKLRCPKLTCGQTVQPADQCCPVCRDSTGSVTSLDHREDSSFNNGR